MHPFQSCKLIFRHQAHDSATRIFKGQECRGPVPRRILRLMGQERHPSKGGECSEFYDDGSSASPAGLCRRTGSSGGTTFSKRVAAIEDFNDRLGELPHRHKIVLPGNYEFFLNDVASARLKPCPDTGMRSRLMPPKDDARGGARLLRADGPARCLGCGWHPAHGWLADSLTAGRFFPDGYLGGYAGCPEVRAGRTRQIAVTYTGIWLRLSPGRMSQVGLRRSPRPCAPRSIAV